MSAPTHAIIDIDVILDRSNTRDVLRALLHAILFHRLFGNIKPQTFEVLDVTIPGVADPDMEKLVNEKVEVFWKGMESGAHNKRGQVSVTYSTKQPKKSWLGITYEEEVPWEQWNINVEVKHPKSEQDRQTYLRTLPNTLTRALQTMLIHTSSEAGRAAVPPITNSNISPFPMKITVKVGGTEVG
ncbi:uncharacterized protein STEHIDRAFT_101279 [Stereum hirsutum FP-91666 SS1]|uniref:uncharacterized protein n=1 Tax=Stereum hirsutum (strain FP-91666) TaxID=721885 RepID=UPI000444A689|nr:uncharacterized protein STEHIDRAFT_101279 [Stereum hirsutum FP-91666 SS1]EIM83183.1 hypothetical protein STEHIDRAFT_101279 [Stereum hirsutum FP-91666 SS1]